LLSADEFISQLYRAIGQIPLVEFRPWALETLRSLVHFDGAVWGTGHVSTREFYTHTHIDVSKALFDDLQASQSINPIYQYHFKHVLDTEKLQNSTKPQSGERIGKPIDMSELLPDQEFFQSDLYQQHFRAHDIERILSSMHLNERSGTFTLLTLYRYDRKQVFTEQEKEIQQKLLYHLIAAASHAYFVELQQRHGDTPVANALCDYDGNYHEVESEFLDLMENWFDDTAHSKLPFAIPEKDTLINGLHVSIEALGELFYIGIRPEQALDKLTAREKEVVEGICSGLTFKTIARNLGLSPSTISNHLYRIYRKLGINSRSELVALLEAKSH
jgi:DNA-binding CsgD family transcriptional regulator